MKPQPITENESSELVLDSYVLYIHNQQCAACGALERFSQCYEVWLHPTKTRSSNLRDLRPVVGGLKPLNMVQIAVPDKKIPVCAMCVSYYFLQGKFPAEKKISTEAWADTLRRKYAPPSAEPKIARTSDATPKMVPSLDQI